MYALLRRFVAPAFDSSIRTGRRLINDTRRHRAGHAVARVVEVNRPDRRQRRAKGKSDSADSYAAADAVLSGRACATPKLGTGIVEAIHALFT